MPIARPSIALVPATDLGRLDEPARSIPVVADTDVLVVGAGPAGIGAAVAAALISSALIGGLVGTWGYTPVFLVLAGLHPLATLVLVLLVRRREDRRR